MTDYFVLDDSAEHNAEMFRQIAAELDKEKSRKSSRPFDPVAKSLIWKAIDKTATQWERKFVDGARRAFERDKRNILAALTATKKAALHRKASVDWGEFGSEAYDYLDGKAVENWRGTFTPLMRGVITEQNDAWSARLGMDWDAQNLFARDWFNKYTLTFAQEINLTTKQEIAAIIASAQAQGWSVSQMQQALDFLFERYINDNATPPEDAEWYLDRTPPYRTEMIARTETIRSSNAGSEQLFQDWGVQRKEWLSTFDDRAREDHMDANGQIVGINEPFDVGGEDLMYPGDPAGDPGNTINCFPGSVEVFSPSTIEGCTRRMYSGQVIDIATKFGKSVTVTPNHPILTSRGWVAAGLLNYGDDLVCGSSLDLIRFSPDIQHRPAKFEELFGSLSTSFVLERVGGNSPDFHGDGGAGDVEIIRLHRELSDGAKSSVLESVENVTLASADKPRLSGITDCPGPGARLDSFGTVSLEMSSNVRFSDNLHPSFRPEVAHTQNVGLASSPWRDARFNKSPRDAAPGYTEMLGQCLDGLPIGIHLDKVVNVNVRSFSGHVYNLQTELGWYTANGIVSHNCRCTLIPVMD